MIYDTHCHLNMSLDLTKGRYFCVPSTDEQLKEMIKRAKENKISNIMQAGTYLTELDRQIDICEKFSDDENISDDDSVDMSDFDLDLSE